METLLIVGGSGFIGSHTCLSLLKYKYKLIVIDNFSNSSPISLDRVLELSNLNGEANKRLEVKKGDIRNLKFIDNIFK